MVTTEAEAQALAERYLAERFPPARTGMPIETKTAGCWGQPGCYYVGARLNVMLRVDAETGKVELA